jgi:hypothetical protein
LGNLDAEQEPFIDRRTGQSGSLNRPIFLVGAERSGTTLLRLMLDHHPEVTWLQEFEYAIDKVGDDGAWPNLDNYREWLATHRIFVDRGFIIDPSLSYPDLINDFLRQHQQRSGKPVIGATIHRHYPRLRHLWPKCRYIYLYRDGRDVARSHLTMGWAGNVWRAIPHWVEAEQDWRLLRQNLDCSDYIEVCYETLIARPEEQLSRICDFIGVAYSPAMLRYPEHTTYGYPDASLTQQWRKKLSKRQLGLIEAIAGDTLQQRGYALSGYPLRPVGRWRGLWLRLHDVVGRQAFRVRRYGLLLAAGETLTKRTGPRSLWKSVRNRLNDVDRQHLK